MLGQSYPVTVMAMNAAVLVKPWHLAKQIMTLLVEHGCPFGPSTTLAASSIATAEPQRLKWLMDIGCQTSSRALAKLVEVGRYDLAYTIHRSGTVYYKQRGKSSDRTRVRSSSSGEEG